MTPAPFHRRGLLSLALAALTLAACSPGPQLVTSTTVNGQTIKVYATGSGARTSRVEQNGGETRVAIGGAQVAVHPDGRVVVNGAETRYGPFAELAVTVGDGDRVEVKVVR